MKIIFRADASLEIGTGHIMRCLTLADRLATQGAECKFICRAHEGNLINFIRSKGYIVHALPIGYQTIAVKSTPSLNTTSNQPVHNSQWLGASQIEDMEACAAILATEHPDWLIVDHYALDLIWEANLAPYYKKLMVIDDLANRSHACNLLLDQTFSRNAKDYWPIVPAGCYLLCGSQYALLRPEFASMRSFSMRRRAQPVMRELLITMGGVDKDNATERVLQALRACPLPENCSITIVMGAMAPWLEQIRSRAQDMPWPTRVLVDVSNMAQLMADSDLAIGAAGATSWERCCLGLPTIMLILADNQRKIAEVLNQAGAAHLFEASKYEHQQLISREYMEPLSLSSMSRAAAAITDGSGVTKVTEILIDKVEHANQLTV